jgi:uncharacterized protein
MTRRVAALIPLGVVMSMAAAIDLALRQTDTFGGLPPFMLTALVTTIGAAVGWWVTGLRWQRWRWELRPNALIVERGVIIRVWQAVPLDRIQFVEITSGPLQRQFGLSTLVVRTAGVRTPAVHLEDLDEPVAERLRSQLSPHEAHA